ncbi:Rieske-like 2Fe-2S protein [Motilibacter rhizosphaerae]|uniref:Rieske-like 2Fe-2S protein n=1 Tax=Motilibacter rhizosphaerae TaxID=598652 RepID=A0A4Q7NXP3_9ACTN|nr:Rieske 2Fe-2S domain-containing protein [Motilibacter rhizosphaerae]RZS91688.1 Rieske-like 2Fe-2S protein [Motilibacter rhizosphaerae]
MSWTPVARSADVGTEPRQVRVGGREWVLVRLEPDGPATLLPALCPHRRVPLVTGSVAGGRLQCAYHGWEFDAAGTCTLVPSLGHDRVPPRASLPPGPPVREVDGAVEVLLDAEDTEAEQEIPGLGNEDPALLRAWHPIALSTEVGAAHEVRLLGRTWSLSRSGTGLRAEPEPYALAERWGLVWLAPEEPLVPLFDEPDAEDAAYAGAWLPPDRTPAPAGFVADNFLDVAHFPFVHTGTFGSEAATVVEAYDVLPEPGGFRSVQEQWFENPEDPGVAAGLRPLRQRRRATYVYRAPFQLVLRLEELDVGAVKTILFFAQPESADSTRIYTKMLLHDIGGLGEPTPQVVANEVAFEQAVLAEDLALQETLTLRVLPLDLKDEMHVRADRLGVALRRELLAFVRAAA